jgi:hypothetical protein
MHGQDITEVLEIKFHPNINRGDGFDLRKSWKPLIYNLSSYGLKKYCQNPKPNHISDSAGWKQEKAKAS